MKSIDVRENLFAELELFAKKHGLTMEQLVDQLLEKEVTEMAGKDIFSPGLKWTSPKEAIVVAKFRKEDLPRLTQWLDDKDNVEFAVLENACEVWLINNDMLQQERNKAAPT